MRYVTILAVTALLIAGVWGSALAQTGDELLALMPDWIEAFNAHDVEEWLSYITDNAAHEYVPAPPPATGIDENRAFMNMVFEAFPDEHMDPQRILASQDIVAMEWISTGTLEGKWMGMGPTGQGGPVPHLTIFDFEGGKAKRLTTYLDIVSFMAVAGLMPPPDPLPPLEPSFTLPDPEPTGLSPLEANTELQVRWNAPDMFSYAKMFHPDADLMVATLGVPLDRSAQIASQELYLLAFPDRKEETVRAVDMGDGWVLHEVVYRGTNDGPYFGIPATGRPAEFRAAIVNRFDADGLVIYEHAYFDNLGVMTQLGLIPPPEPSTVSPASWGQIKAKFR